MQNSLAYMVETAVAPEVTTPVYVLMVFKAPTANKVIICFLRTRVVTTFLH